MRQIRSNIVFSTFISLFITVLYFIADMLGVDRMHPEATPKQFFELLKEWPRFLKIGAFTFIGALFWKASQKEPSYMICCYCMEILEKKNGLSTQCVKCGEQLEHLEGFYDRHPEKRKSMTRGQVSKYQKMWYALNW